MKGLDATKYNDLPTNTYEDMPTNIYQDMPETFSDIPDDVFENIPRAVTARANNRKARTKADLNVDKNQEVTLKIVKS